ASLERRLRSGGVLVTAGVEVYPSVDAALEAEEARILSEAGVSYSPTEASTLSDVLVGSGVDAGTIERYTERVALAADDGLIEQGVPAVAMDLITSGRVTAERARPGLPPERFETMGRGSIVGEVGLLTERPRAATVRADPDVVAYKLTRQSL